MNAVLDRVLARIRWWRARARSLWWVAAALGAALSGVVVAGRIAALDAARQRWAMQVTVWVAGRDLRPGERIVATARPAPHALVPPRAVGSDPTGHVARHSLAAGVVVTDDAAVAAGPAALIPAGSVAVPVAASAGVFSPGDEVTVFAAGRRVADGVVSEIAGEDHRVVFVAVAQAEAPALAAVAAQPGAAVIARRAIRRG